MRLLSVMRFMRRFCDPIDVLYNIGSNARRGLQDLQLRTLVFKLARSWDSSCLPSATLSFE